MDKNKKGFTLIELLAVIVILAIIALIAVPIIMNVISKARKSAFEDSAYGIVKAAELYYSNQLLESDGMTDDQEFTVVNGVFKNEKGDTLDISGSIPNNGKVIVTKDGKVALAISNGEYYIQKATTEDQIKANSLKKDNIIESELSYKTAFVAASDGTEVPACIVNNTECSNEDIKNGLKVGVQVNNTEKYDFYVMNDDTETGKITLIMNKNLGENVVWVNREDYLEAGGTEEEWNEYRDYQDIVLGHYNKGPLTALNYLESQTSSWTNIPLETYILTDDLENAYSSITRTARARLITYSEAQGLGCMYDTSGVCPTWLYGNLNSVSPQGYWTSSTFSVYGYDAMAIDFSDGIENQTVININQGVRPVITILKKFS